MGVTTTPASKRPPNISDKMHSAAVRQSVNVARYEAHLRKVIEKQMDDLRKEILAQMFDKSQVRTAYSKARAEVLLQSVDKVIESNYKAIAVDQQARIVELVRVQMQVADSIVNGAVGVTLIDTAFSDTFLKRLASNVLIEGAPSAEWWSRAAKVTRNKFADNIRQGILRGETLNELVDRVQAKGTGLVDVATRQAEALVRTSVMTATNDIRQAVFKEHEEIFSGIQWVATLDSRTTEICMALDGLKWDNELEPIDHDIRFPGPTAHWGCRSTQIPILKSWDELLGDKKLARLLDKAEKANPGTRASMDGQVSAKMNYKEWLESRTEEEQKEILGPGKWAIWRDGRLSLPAMLDHSGRPLTLRELRKRV